MEASWRGSEPQPAIIIAAIAADRGLTITRKLTNRAALGKRESQGKGPASIPAVSVPSSGAGDGEVLVGPPLLC